MQDVFQQALNSAWWLGYWTALHQQKVSLSLTLVTITDRPFCFQTGAAPPNDENEGQS